MRGPERNERARFLPAPGIVTVWPRRPVGWLGELRRLGVCDGGRVEPGWPERAGPKITQRFSDGYQLNYTKDHNSSLRCVR